MSRPLVLNHIGGADIAGAGEQIEVRNPATGEVIGVLGEATAEQVAEAVQAAALAFETGAWPREPMAHRRKVLRAIAEAIRADAGELAALQVAEGGMPISQARGHIAAAAGWFDYYADFITTTEGRHHGQTPGAMVVVEREPMGVCALFSPWNVPIALSAIKLAPALAAGNTVILKPSEMTPLSTRRLVDCLPRSGLPPGTVSMVNGRGPVTGAALARHPAVAMISFTGGPTGGAQVAEAAARRAVPCIMELGGKSATIVFEDADQDAALAGALRAAFANNGQACLAGSRILVQERVADRFIDALAQRAGAMRIGDPMDAATEIGPLVSAAHHGRVAAFLKQPSLGKDTLLFGGDRPADLPPHLAGGHFLRPAGILAADSGSRAWRDEIFGPVVTIRTFRTDDEAIALANDSSFGLSGYVWTRSLDRALRTAKALRTGTVVINQSFVRELNAPFGGYKGSGVGREGGVYSFANFTQLKTTVLCHG